MPYKPTNQINLLFYAILKFCTNSKLLYIICLVIWGFRICQLHRKLRPLPMSPPIDGILVIEQSLVPTTKLSSNLQHSTLGPYWTQQAIREAPFLLVISSSITYTFRRCPWCNGYRRRKWTWRHEFKSWTWLIAFHITLIPLGKVWIQIFSLQLWVNSKAD